MYRVEMFIDGDWYVYGTYNDRNKANEIAKEVEEQRQCRTYISKVDYTMANAINC